MAKQEARILLVDDDPGLLHLLELRLKTFGYQVRAVESGATAMGCLDVFQPHLVITDLRMDGMDGMQLMDQIHRQRPGLPVLMITAHGTIPDAVQATQQGAFGFLTKPVDKSNLAQQVEKALTVFLPGDTSTMPDEPIVTRSAVMNELLRQAERLAQTSSSVLITGESGTGKELIARYIHNSGPRRAREFVDINCAAIPSELLESELFGHEKGAFTGASGTREGLIQTADGGTLFLDEIGDMPMALQAKLLRVLQEGVLRPLGMSRSVKVDVRVISATHQNIETLMEKGDFREDLFYRLNVVGLKVSPLRERREDIPLLVNHFLEQLAGRSGESPKSYAPTAMQLLVKSDWPGNVRQLYNVVEQNVVLSSSRIINAHTVEKALGQESDGLPSLQQARDNFTRKYITQLLAMTNGNVSRAARVAKRNRTDFYRLLSRLNIDPGQFKATDTKTVAKQRQS